MSNSDESQGKGPSKARGRPNLRTPEELKAASVRGGIEVLTSSGLETDMRGDTIEPAAKAAGIPRASIYRAWKRESSNSPGPQQEFQTAVAVEILSNFVVEQSGVFDVILDLLGALTAEEEPLAIAAAITQMTEPQRCSAFAQMVAAGAAANMESLRGNALFHTHAGLMASINSQGEPPMPMVEAMTSGETIGEARWVELYQFIFAAFGMRIKPHYRYEHLALAGMVLSTGLGQRQFSPYLEGIARPIVDAESGEPVSDDTNWNLFGVCSMGLIAEFCEADPDSDLATDPRSC